MQPTKRPEYDLIVIGGGPAGTSSAITAARAGAGVLLLERGRLPRQRVCGEFVSAESLALLAGLLGRTAADLQQRAVQIPEARLALSMWRVFPPPSTRGRQYPHTGSI